MSAVPADLAAAAAAVAASVGDQRLNSRTARAATQRLCLDESPHGDSSLYLACAT